MTDSAIRPITPRDFEDAEGLGDWRVLGDGAACFVRTPSFADSTRLTEHDIEVARAISGVAGRLGFRADPSVLQSMLIVPGASDTTAVFPFWRAVLGYDPRADSPDEDLVDPLGRLPMPPATRPTSA